MKTNQQNEKLNTLLRTTIMCLLVLTGIMQMHAIDYTPYKPGAYQEQTFPVATFQSTSAYATDDWTNPNTPMLNADGSVSIGAYMSGPHRAIANPDEEEEGEGGGENEGDEEGDNNWNGSNQPLGDALLPLLACALLYILARRRKSAI